MWISQLWRSVFLASVYTSCTAEGFPTAEIQIRHPGEPGSVPFSLQPDLSPHPPHHPHPLQDKEHPEDYSTDPSITSGDYLKEYDLDDVDEEEIEQFNEIEDEEEEEYDDEGLEKDQEVEASEPNRIAKLQIIVRIKKKRS
ncbi:leiomodin-3 [Eurytemora carolleeae]|uniref:leiomodin-3 n=1 Tax=Eurytemora carolleeae TaxID=1294199 RepID=UPI000C78E6FE|nr:leiomodin-3 [Eurytemora carolleeae]|eukprot:XP_023322082.1 leiomodin-3-like [Eurytemora affinis]